MMCGRLRFLFRYTNIDDEQDIFQVEILVEMMEVRGRKGMNSVNEGVQTSNEADTSSDPFSLNEPWHLRTDADNRKALTS